MVFAAALPLSLHREPERVANIGFGSGLTSAPCWRASASNRSSRSRSSRSWSKRRARASTEDPPGIRGSAQPHRVRGCQDVLRHDPRAVRHHHLRAVQSVGQRRRHAVLRRVLQPHRRLSEAGRAAGAVAADLRDRHVDRRLDRDGHEQGTSAPMPCTTPTTPTS